MTHAVTLELSAEAFAALSRQAATAGVPPARLAADALERQYCGPGHPGGAARGRFERRFGSVDLGRPTGTDNDRIDADLAREYGGGAD